MNAMVAQDTKLRRVIVPSLIDATTERDARTRRDPRREPRRGSETRLQAAVVADRKRDEKDPYADVPCTD